MECSSIDILPSAVRLALSSLLVIAGIIKYVRQVDLTSIIEALNLPHNQISWFFFKLLPFVEIALGGILFTGILNKWALYAITFLLMGFTVILLILILKGYKGNCACFGGIDDHQIGTIQVVRNCVFIAATLLLCSKLSPTSCVGVAVWRLPISVYVVAVLLLCTTTAIYMIAVEIEFFLRQTAVYKRTSYRIEKR
jgi:hypothetical protein